LVSAANIVILVTTLWWGWKFLPHFPSSPIQPNTTACVNPCVYSGIMQGWYEVPVTGCCASHVSRLHTRHLQLRRYRGGICGCDCRLVSFQVSRKWLMTMASCCCDMWQSNGTLIARRLRSSPFPLKFRRHNELFYLTSTIKAGPVDDNSFFFLVSWGCGRTGCSWYIGHSLTNCSCPG
jgi:hypothetical protein